MLEAVDKSIKIVIIIVIFIANWNINIEMDNWVTERAPNWIKMKTIMCQMKNTLDIINSQLDIAGEKNSELEYLAVKTTQKWNTKKK